MKRLLLFLVLAATTLSGLAQSSNEAFYIYRNDGQFNAFFRDEVEKMEYSNIDTDGIEHDEMVTQLVYTADSIYSIPLAAIDSVGFVTPETVYKQGVIKLEGDVRDNIVSTDSLTIYFRPDTPFSLLPKVGDYLFTEEVSSVFPIGFIGKVETVQPEDGLLAVSCSQVDFEDVFEYYYYVSGKTVEASRRLDEQPQVDERSWERVWSPGTFNFSITNLTKPNIYPDPLGDLSFDVANNQNISLTPTFRVKYVRIVTPSRGTEVSLDISEEDVIAEDFSMSGHIKWNHDLLTTNDIPFLELGIPFLWLYGKAGVFLNADATISGEQHFSQIYKYTFHCEGSSRSLFGTRASLNGIYLSSEHSGEIMAKGSIELGIYGEIGVAFVDSRIASVAYRGEVGIGVEGNAMLYKKDAETALHSTDVYKTLQGNDVKFKWFYRTGLPVKLLWFGWSNKHKPHDDVFARVSLVPNFSDTKLERDPDDKTTLFASTKVNGACLPVDLGFTLFEQQSTNSVPTSYSRLGYVGMKSEMYASFFDMPTSKKYEVYPTVKLLGIEMLAEPKAELEETTEQEESMPIVKIVDFKVTKSQYKQGEFYNEGKNYDYRFDAATTVTLSNSEGVTDWGYIYRDPNGRTKEISLLQFGTSYTDTRYAYFRNEAKSTVALCPYVKLRSGKRKEGNWSIFEVSYQPDGETCKEKLSELHVYIDLWKDKTNMLEISIIKLSETYYAEATKHYVYGEDNLGDEMRAIGLQLSNKVRELNKLLEKMANNSNEIYLLWKRATNGEEGCCNEAKKVYIEFNELLPQIRSYYSDAQDALKVIIIGGELGFTLPEEKEFF